MELQDFGFEGAPLHWSLELTDPRYASLQQLLEKFMEEWSWGKKPLGWVQNPETKDGQPYFADGTNNDYIVAPYRKNFYIVIERSLGEIFGPHIARLMYRSWQVSGEISWVAVCQIEAMWHSDERMLKALTTAIDSGELYQSLKTAETIVLL